MIRRPPRSTQSRSSAASDVYKRQVVRSQEVVRQRLAWLRGVLKRGIEVGADRDGVQVLAGDQVVSRATHVSDVDRRILDLLLDAKTPVHRSSRGIEAEQVVDAGRSDGAAAGGVSIQVAVVERGAECHRRVAVGIHGRVALQAILEHAEAAAYGGLAGAEYIPGEAQPGTEVHAARGVQAGRVAVLAADGRAVRYRTGARNEQAYQRIGVDLAAARIHRHAFPGCRVDDGLVQHGGIGAAVQGGTESGDGMV